MNKNKVKEFFLDLIRETKGGKVSSKKIWGHVVMLLVCMTYVMDGFNWYEVDHHLFDTAMIAGCTLLGLALVGRAFGKNPATGETKTDEPA